MTSSLTGAANSGRIRSSGNSTECVKRGSNRKEMRFDPSVRDELGVTPYALSRDAGIDKGKLSLIINGKASITADTALRLAAYFGTSADSWMNLQSRYDLEVAKDLSLRRIEREVRSYQSSAGV